MRPRIHPQSQCRFAATQLSFTAPRLERLGKLAGLRAGESFVTDQDVVPYAITAIGFLCGLGGVANDGWLDMYV